jgi:hypothetical protein
MTILILKPMCKDHMVEVALSWYQKMAQNRILALSMSLLLLSTRTMYLQCVANSFTLKILGKIDDIRN